MNLSLIAGWRDSAGNVTPAQERSGDLILKDANICAVDEHNPQVQAVAVKGDRTIFVGSDTDTQTGTTTRVFRPQRRYRPARPD